jgi:hypothetical protein
MCNLPKVITAIQEDSPSMTPGKFRKTTVSAKRWQEYGKPNPLFLHLVYDFLAKPVLARQVQLATNGQL